MIIENKAKCRLCQQTIESKHTHDFVTCGCGEISVDGGKDYLSRLYKNKENLIELSETEEDKEDELKRILKPIKDKYETERLEKILDKAFCHYSGYKMDEEEYKEFVQDTIQAILKEYIHRDDVVLDEEKIWDVAVDWLIKLINHCNANEKPYGIPNDISWGLAKALSSKSKQLIRSKNETKA